MKFQKKSRGPKSALSFLGTVQCRSFYRKRLRRVTKLARRIWIAEGKPNLKTYNTDELFAKVGMLLKRHTSEETILTEEPING